MTAEWERRQNWDLQGIPGNGAHRHPERFENNNENQLWRRGGVDAHGWIRLIRQIREHPVPSVRRCATYLCATHTGNGVVHELDELGRIPPRAERPGGAPRYLGLIEFQPSTYRLISQHSRKNP